MIFARAEWQEERISRVSSMKLVYLAALHNSGSTVVALLANAHPEMVSPGEMIGPGGRFHGPAGPVCSCGRLVAHCPFWLAVSRRYTANGHPWKPAAWGLRYEFQGHPLLSRLAFGRPGASGRRDRILATAPFVGKKLKDLHKRNLCFAQSILAVSGTTSLLDASKHPERIVHFMRIREFDLSVVHLIRDPRGWCNSRKRTGKNVAMTAPKWLKRNQYIERLTSALPSQKHIMVRYEDFCRNPQAIMDRIFHLASLPSAAVPEDLRGVSHHLLGNRMRNRGDARIQADTTWQEQLNKTEIASIERATASLAMRYGYDFGRC